MTEFGGPKGQKRQHNSSASEPPQKRGKFGGGGGDGGPRGGRGGFRGRGGGQSRPFSQRGGRSFDGNRSFQQRGGGRGGRGGGRGGPPQSYGQNRSFQQRGRGRGGGPQRGGRSFDGNRSFQQRGGTQIFGQKRTFQPQDDEKSAKKKYFNAPSKEKKKEMKNAIGIIGREIENLAELQKLAGQAQDKVAATLEAYDNRQLIIQQIPENTTTDEIKSLSKDIKFVRILKNFGFIEFASEAKAVKNFNKLQDATIKGQPIVLKVGSKSESNKPKETVTNDIDPFKLFVTGFRSEMSFDDLKKMFPNAAEVWIKSSDNKESGDASARHGRVFFDSADDALPYVGLAGGHLKVVFGRLFKIQDKIVTREEELRISKGKKKLYKVHVFKEPEPVTETKTKKKKTKAVKTEKEPSDEEDDDEEEGDDDEGDENDDDEGENDEGEDDDASDDEEEDEEEDSDDDDESDNVKSVQLQTTADVDEEDDDDSDDDEEEEEEDSDDDDEGDNVNGVQLQTTADVDEEDESDDDDDSDDESD